MDKFITVMAILDENTQQYLQQIQNRLTVKISPGTQTMGIPFHITLGSYSPSDTDEIVERINKVSKTTASFSVRFSKFNHFANKVLYLEPELSEKLVDLRQLFESDYANNCPWVPHATIYCDDESNIIKAREMLDDPIEPVESKIIGIELGEFFPVRHITRGMFNQI